MTQELYCVRHFLDDAGFHEVGDVLTYDDSTDDQKAVIASLIGSKLISVDPPESPVFSVGQQSVIDEDTGGTTPGDPDAPLGATGALGELPPGTEEPESLTRSREEQEAPPKAEPAKRARKATKRTRKPKNG
jgi:hypothetical protein